MKNKYKQYLEEAKVKCKALNINYCRAVEYQFSEMYDEGYTVDEAMTQIQLSISTQANFTV